MMRYLSVCSGIEAATVAWHPLGWQPSAFSEIDPFASAVLRHYYPTVPNRGDMTKFQEWPDAAIDVLVGGTPCQSFSVAGLRAGLADPRGNLALTYLAVLDRYRPRWCCWENVPGAMSADDSGAMGAFLGGLAKLGYMGGYRVLDAQYFGLAQRRKRVFVVGYLGDWRRAAAVLFERASLSGHPPPRREAGQGVANSLTERPDRGGGNSEGQRLIPLLAPTVHSRRTSGCGLGTDFDCDGGVITCPTLRAGGNVTGGHRPPGTDVDTADSLIAVAFSENQRAEVVEAATVQSLNNGGGKPGQGYPAVRSGIQVRRLTPRECERLQGFPDDYTLIPYRGKPAADGNRYKALGNSMAVPVMAWIGRRIQLVDSLTVD